MSRRDLVLAAAGLLLLAVAIVRLAVPDRSRMRPLSIEALEIASEPIQTGESLTREATWSPPEDVYVVGWHRYIGAPSAKPLLMLTHGKIRLFSVEADSVDDLLNPSFLPGGTGYRLNKGERLTLHYRINNGGPPGVTHGASVLVYFVPVEGN